MRESIKMIGDLRLRLAWRCIIIILTTLSTTLQIIFLESAERTKILCSIIWMYRLWWLNFVLIFLLVAVLCTLHLFMLLDSSKNAFHPFKLIIKFLCLNFSPSLYLSLSLSYFTMQKSRLTLCRAAIGMKTAIRIMS